MLAGHGYGCSPLCGYHSLSSCFVSLFFLLSLELQVFGNANELVQR